MKRPVGLILSAVALSLAALFFLLMTAVITLAGVSGAPHSTTQPVPHFFIYLMLAISLFYAALAAWAILTVIGILRLRSWGRYSILIIGAGLSVIGIFGALFTLIGKAMLPAQPTQPPVDPHIMSIVFLLLAAFYLFVAAVGIWWLVYFNLRAVRDLFANPDLLAQPDTGPFSHAPTAIKIIGGFLLFGSACCVLCVFLPFPAFLFGFIVPPAAAHVLYICFAIISAFAGYGLLRLKESARLLTIGFLILGSCNLIFLALPWYQARLSLYSAQITSAIPRMLEQPQISFRYSAAIYFICAIWGVLVYGVIFWLLHRYRAAFKTPTPPPNPMLEA
jgi:hypothetical protein